MADPANLDLSLLRIELSKRAPTTKEELFWFCREVIQVPCLHCGGSGHVAIPSPGVCPQCGGVGQHGFHWGRKAICANHSAPLDIFAEIYFSQIRHMLLIAPRNGGKTQMLTLLALLKMHFSQYTISHMGAVESQAHRARDYLHKLLNIPPWSEDVKGQLNQGNATFHNGAGIEWLTGTLNQACLPGSAGILTDPYGIVPIEVIVKHRLFCRVKSYNFRRQKWQWQPVIGWHDNGPETEFYALSLGKRPQQNDLVATGNHMIPLSDGTKKPLSALNVGDHVCVHGQYEPWRAYEQERLIEMPVQMVEPVYMSGERRYDLTVAENHNYCVGSGILVSNSGGHPVLAILDEVDMVDPPVRQRFMKTPSGPSAMFVEASTHYIQQGTISQILKETPNLPVRRFCIWESLQQCEYDCDRMPQMDGSLGKCALYETVEYDSAGRMHIVPLCAGKIARECDGHNNVVTEQLNFAKADLWSRRTEYLCETPDRPVGGRAYWGFHPSDNRLLFDPEIRADAPLEWFLDFNPGVGMRMCSGIIQQQRDGSYAIIDEIVLKTSSTLEVTREFLRRYGLGGSLVDSHAGGVWVYGDRGGHNRNSTTGQTDYDLIVSMLRNTPGFRLMIPAGAANPPLVDRLNLVNKLLCDEHGYRALRVAPRCTETMRELEMMPLGADRQKDKSERIQRALGLSHLGDGLEYWAWSRFGRAGVVSGSSPRTGPVVIVGSTRRASAEGRNMGRRTSMER